MNTRLFLFLIFLSLPSLVFATNDVWQLLKRAEVAGNQQPLRGSYLHQMNNTSETFRLERAAVGDQFTERRWSLDGPPREIVRQGETITCYAHDKTALNAAKLSAMHLFPDVLSGRLDDIAQSYTLEQLGQDRVAQRDCTLLELRPKDKQRFSVRLCIEPTTALPLKMLVLGPRGETVEQYSFADLDFTALKDKGVGRDKTKPNYELEARLAFHPPGLPTAGTGKEASPVEVTGLPPGFRLLHSVQRTLAGQPERAVRQVVFSDGLVMLSLFIEPAREQLRPDKVMNLHGAINMATLTQSGQRLTLVGDLPEPMLATIIRSLKVPPKP